MSFVFNSQGKYSHTVFTCVKCYKKIKEQVCNCHSRGERMCICPVIRQCRDCDPSTYEKKFIFNTTKNEWVAAAETICDCGRVMVHPKLSPAYAYRCKSCPIDLLHNTVQPVKEYETFIVYRIINNMYYDPIRKMHFPAQGPPRGLMKRSNCLCSRMH